MTPPRRTIDWGHTPLETYEFNPLGSIIHCTAVCFQSYCPQVQAQPPPRLFSRNFFHLGSFIQNRAFHQPGTLSRHWLLPTVIERWNIFVRRQSAHPPAVRQGLPSIVYEYAVELADPARGREGFLTAARTGLLSLLILRP